MNITNEAKTWGGGLNITENNVSHRAWNGTRGSNLKRGYLAKDAKLMMQIFKGSKYTTR